MTTNGLKQPTEAELTAYLEWINAQLEMVRIATGQPELLTRFLLAESERLIKLGAELGYIRIAQEDAQ